MPAPTRCWLMKSEPAVFSIQHLARDRVTDWTGVRNYQARNFMRDDMRVGDAVLFYHSNADPSGVAGLARVSRTARPDPSAWRKGDPAFDPRSTPDQPVWVMVEVEFVEAFPRVVSLDQLRADPALADLLVLRRGQRLSVQPVTPAHYQRVCRLGRGAG